MEKLFKFVELNEKKKENITQSFRYESRDTTMTFFNCTHISVAVNDSFTH
jgi:hypothetical protein